MYARACTGRWKRYNGKNTLCLNALVANGYVGELVGRASSETPQFQSRALKILYMCLLCPDRAALQLAIDAGAVDIVLLHLKNENSESVEFSAKIIGLLCSHQGPLQKVINSSDGIPTLLSLLNGTNVATIAKCMAAMMVILSDDKAKFKFVDADGIGTILKLIQHTDRAVLLHVLKMISVLAPHPKAKTELNAPVVISRLEIMEDDSNDKLIAKCARIAKVDIKDAMITCMADFNIRETVFPARNNFIFFPGSGKDASLIRLESK